ncbi:MAG: peptidase S41 [Acidobacteria bacterium]|nr:peptidase S41 [Acidobacteriota bacterium]
MTKRSLGRLALLVLSVSAAALGQTKLLRFPDLHGDKVVFVYAGDLWKASAEGGVAARLTAHPGLELFPKFSPDGRWIAFTGQYDGDEQVYVIPAEGGVPKQLTWYPARGPFPDRWGFDNQVEGWTPDGKGIVFRGQREFWGPKDGRLYTVSVDGGLPVALPMPVSGAGVVGPNGKDVLYSPLFRDFRTWKRYQGGWAQDLYIFYPETSETLQVTDNIRTDRDPMWMGDKIYFASDRTGKLNLFEFEPKSRKTKQITKFNDWDVRWPSDDGDHRIVYELDGELQILDVKTGKTRKLSITAPDDGLHMRPSRIAAAKFQEDAELSPKGERVLIGARGDIFTVPVEKGPTRNLTDTPDAHERWARWSPDGKKIAYVSDESGEDQIWTIDQDGRAPAEQLTSGLAEMLYAPEWSPDSKRIAFSSKSGKVYVLEVATKQLQEIADDTWGQVRSYVWSPRGGHLAFVLQVTERARALQIWSVADGQVRQVTGELFDVSSPAWDPEGKYIYYLSDRTYAPQISSVEWNYAGNRQTDIFALALRKDVPHPFPPESDEVKIEAAEPDKKDDEKKPEEKKDDKKADEGPVVIDFDGLAERVVRIPVEAENYVGLSAKKGHLIYLKTPPFYYGRGADMQPSVEIFSFEKRKGETLVDDAGTYALSRDGEKILIRQGGGWGVYDAKPGGKSSKKGVSMSGMMVDSVPKQEWETIFDEVWRRYRDFFYVENMHGYDWAALREQYKPLLQHVAHRMDLNYVIGEMIAELSVGHAYIAGGDYDLPARPRTALPGAEIELDAAAGRYRIVKILPGQNAEPMYRSPLTEVGVDAREGDYLLAIDGEELSAGDNPYRMLRYKNDRPVELTLNAQPTMDGSRKTTFRPITDESNLRYLAWITANRQRVDEASNGEVGYLHIPDMGADGIREFIKYFYPQMRKKGLVIDVRGNGGGNVSQMILERLQRKLLGTRFSRNNDHPTTYPETVFYGHMVCLISENSASDGDIFPARFQKAGLGPLIGKRSWGGVIGITNRGDLLDGGQVFVPEFATNDVDGSWIIEGYGVKPDIEVENDPASVIAGRDPQLERGIAEVLDRIRKNPMPLPERPAPPVKTQ